MHSLGQKKNIKWFNAQTGKYPGSLQDIVVYANEKKNDTANHFHIIRKLPCAEYITDIAGNSKEYPEINGKGGWYYNKDTGQLKVNLIKPVKHYLWLYFGPERNEIPSDW